MKQELKSTSILFSWRPVASADVLLAPAGVPLAPADVLLAPPEARWRPLMTPYYME